MRNSEGVMMSVRLSVDFHYGITSQSKRLLSTVKKTADWDEITAMLFIFIKEPRERRWIYW